MSAEVFARAERLVVQGRIEEAIGEYERLLEEDPGDLRALCHLGDLQVRVGRNDEACKAYTKIAERYAEDGLVPKAIAMYAKINRLEPSRLDVYEKLGDLFATQGLKTEAEGQYRTVANNFAKQGDFTRALALEKKLSRLAGDLERQRECWKRQREFRTAAIAQAEEMDARGEIEKAIEEYRRLLEVDPGDAEPLRRISELGARKTGRATFPTLEVSARIPRAIETVIRGLCERFGLRRGFADWDTPSSAVTLPGERFTMWVVFNTTDFPSPEHGHDEQVTITVCGAPEDDLSGAFREDLASWLVDSLGASGVQVKLVRTPLPFHRVHGEPCEAARAGSADRVERKPAAAPAVTLRFVLVETAGRQPDSMKLGDSISCRLDDSHPIIVGRAPDADVVVEAPTVGRRVLRLRLEKGVVWATDLGSGNGFSVEIDGAVRYRSDCELPDRCTLRIGRIAFRVEIVPSRLPCCTSNRCLREGLGTNASPESRAVS
jgi:DNA-binding SARP family transcriptional activator